MAKVSQRLAATACIQPQFVEYHVRLRMLNNPVGDGCIQIAVHRWCHFAGEEGVRNQLQIVYLRVYNK